jgi:NADH:ubiquinone oxidoreductase subunit K
LNLENFLLLSAVIFCIGLYGAVTKRNIITVLMCIELMFNAVNIAAVAMSRYIIPRDIADNLGAVESQIATALEANGQLTDTVLPTLLTGQVFSIFIVTVAAAEIALGLGIVIAIYRNRDTVDITEINMMKG